VRQIPTIYLFAGFMQSDVVGELAEPHPTTDFWCDTSITYQKILDLHISDRPNFAIIMITSM
jgi:hypothetical protein